MFWSVASPSDAPVLAELNQQLISDEGHRNPMNAVQLEERMRGWLTSDYRAILFRDHAELVAYAILREREPGEAYLRQFFVVRHRRRQGIGRQALRLLRTEVLPRGTRVVLDVLIHNRTAYAFWIACDFRDYAIILEQVAEQCDP